MKRRAAWLAGTVLSTQLALAAPAAAQVVTHIVADTAPGVSTGTAVTTRGTVTTINGGTLAGGNLFHSFQTFSLGTGDTAAWTYTAGDPTTVHNVINRVTGGSASQIDGTLDSTALPNANFYFINPAGVVFGANARVNVPAAAYFSTASELRFADGAAYSAVTPSGSTFTVAPVASFGFLGGEGDMAVESANSFLPRGGPLSLSAANLEIDGATLESGGAIRLYAVGDQAANLPIAGAPTTALSGEMIVADDTVVASVGAGGSISAYAGTLTIDGSGLEGLSGAPVTIGVGDLAVQDGAAILSTAPNVAGSSGGAISVVASGEVDLLDGGEIEATTSGKGAAGNVTVQAGSLNMNAVDGGDGLGVVAIGSDTLGAGRGGLVSVTVNGPLAVVNGFIRSVASASGNAGAVSVEAQSLAIGDAGEITSDTLSSGAAGNVTVTTGTLLIENGLISSSNSSGDLGDSLASGAAGAVLVNVAGDAAIGPNGFITTAAIDRLGAAGDVTVNVGGTLSLQGESLIDSHTDGAGAAGVVTINAGALSLDLSGIDAESAAAGGAPPPSGAAGQVSLNIAGALTLTTDSLIFTDTNGSGPAGDVVVKAGSVSLSGQSSIRSDALYTGPAGNVSVTTGALTIEGVAGVPEGQNTSISTDADGYSGDAGQVTIAVAGNATVKDGGSISSLAEGLSGNAGKVTVSVGGNLTVIDAGDIITSAQDSDGSAGDVTVSAANLVLDGGAADDPDTSISSNTLGAGQGGAISIAVAGDLAIRNGANVTTDTFGSGAAGDIAVTAGNLSIVGTSGGTTLAGISSDSRTVQIPIGPDVETLVGTGNAGRVTVTVAGDLSMQEGAFITSAADDAEGAAGDITVSAASLEIDGGADLPPAATSRIETNTFGAGGGGAITIAVSGPLVMSNAALVEADTFGAGNAGSVAISGGALTLSDATIASNTFDAGDAGSIRISAGQLSADGASISSSAAPDASGNAGSVAIDATGAVALTDGADVLTLAADPAGAAGDVQITAAKLTLDTSGSIQAFTKGAGPGGQITLAIAGDMSLSNGAVISTASLGAGDAGTVTVHAASLELNPGAASGTPAPASISSNADSAGHGGQVIVGVSGPISITDGFISSDTLGAGDAGAVSVQAQSLAIGADGQISSDTFAAGNAGDVSVTAGSLTMTGELAAISSTNRSDDFSDGLKAGNAGAVTVDVSGDATIGQDAQISTATFSALGNGGDLVLNVGGTLTVEDFALVDSETIGSGHAGTVTINAGALDMSDQGGIDSESSPTSAAFPLLGKGDAGQVTLTVAHTLAMTDSFITTDTFGDGRAGDVAVKAGVIDVTSSTITSNTEGAGDAGNVSVTAGAMTVDGVAGLLGPGHTGIATNANDLGDAGQVSVSVAGDLTLENGGVISSAANGPAGHAGQVTVAVGGTLVLTSGGQIATNSINANAAGDILVQAPVILVDGLGAAISSANTGSSGGAAGSITVDTDPITLADGGSITTDSASGAAGAITLNFADGGVLLLQSSGALSQITTTSATTTAGQITIDGPSAIVMNGGEIQALGPFKGAFVTIDAGTVVQSSDRLNPIAVAGTLVFNTQFEDVNKAVTLSDLSFIDASKVLRGECAAQAVSGETSALVTSPTGPYAASAAAEPAGAPFASLAPGPAACGPAPAAE